MEVAPLCGGIERQSVRKLHDRAQIDAFHLYAQVGDEVVEQPRFLGLRRNIALLLAACGGSSEPTKGDLTVYVAAPLSGFQANGGSLATFDDAIKAAYEDMYADTKMIRERRKMKKMQMPAPAEHKH